MSSLPERIESLAATDGGRVAIIDVAGPRTWTYAELAAGMRATAGALKAHGLAPGDRVATLGAASSAFLVGDLGVLASGCVRVPLDPSLTAAEHQAQMIDAGARAILFEPHEQNRAQALATIALDVTTIPANDTPWTPQAPTALASLNYTGGTTGAPKAVMLTHAAFDTIHRTIVEHRPIRAEDRFLNVRPLWPIAAVIATAHLYAGATVVLGGRFDPAQLAKQLATHRATATSLVPTMLTRVLDLLEPGVALHGLDALRAIDVGGSALSARDRARAFVAFGPRLGVIYGLTEASWTCYHPPGTDEQETGAVGYALGPNEVVIRDSNGNAVPAGEEGEVTIAGPHLMTGYWGHDDATRAALRAGWLHTGDLGRLAPSGLLTLTGRIKDVIRSGSKSVIPAEVEAVIASHPAVAECAVVGLPDAQWGEIVAAAVVAKPYAQLDADVVFAHCGGLLAGFKKPRRIVIVDALPRSHYGKIQRAKVIELLRSSNC